MRASPSGGVGRNATATGAWISLSFSIGASVSAAKGIRLPYSNRPLTCSSPRGGAAVMVRRAREWQVIAGLTVAGCLCVAAAGYAQFISYTDHSRAILEGNW